MNESHKDIRWAVLTGAGIVLFIPLADVIAQLLVSLL